MCPNKVFYLDYNIYFFGILHIRKSYKFYIIVLCISYDDCVEDTFNMLIITYSLNFMKSHSKRLNI